MRECADEDPITGKWTELGMMQCAEEDEFSFRAFSLDATVFAVSYTHLDVYKRQIHGCAG